MTEELGKPSLWLPERNKVLLQAMGKTVEEANELGAILARCMIQGIGGADPKTRKPNREALLDELADIAALMAVLKSLLHMTEAEKRQFNARCDSKVAHKEEWLSMVADYASRHSRSE